MELDARRTEKQKQLAQYKQLNTMLAPFENPHHTIQQNLVTRDGELSKELEKMRLLIARVAVRVGQLKEKPIRDDQDAMSSTDPEKNLSALFDAA